MKVTPKLHNVLVTAAAVFSFAAYLAGQISALSDVSILGVLGVVAGSLSYLHKQ